jgi:hypothetical protein
MQSNARVPKRFLMEMSIHEQLLVILKCSLVNRHGHAGDRTREEKTLGFQLSDASFQADYLDGRSRPEVQTAQASLPQITRQGLSELPVSYIS